MLTNRDVYLKDPSKIELVNKGVANVNDDTDDASMDVLRYELETFVCKGQYEKGLTRVLDAFLSNVDKGKQQPGVWVSGFYGSGKSHFVKMLRALWTNTRFRNGDTAREIVHGLPLGIRDMLAELDNKGSRHGGLHAASGTLGAGAKSVRLALLAIVFKSVGLPEQYGHARFIMWLKQQGKLDRVRELVEAQGTPWRVALDNLYVSKAMFKSLAEAMPEEFGSADDTRQHLNNQFPRARDDVTSKEMTDAIRQALAEDHSTAEDARIPLTILALDELQQYIGNGKDGDKRANDVQEVVEACSKNIRGADRFMFIGTGQSAMTGTVNIKKLEGRFTLRVELSDADVDTVIREVILPKRADTKTELDEVMAKNEGEVSKHLQNTSIGHRQEDSQYFTSDYPILPVRRRFWEGALRALDQSGTESQLRNQLSMVHKAIRTNLDKPLGNVIPADYLYFESADKLIQSGSLPRKLYDDTKKWYESENAGDKLLARICGTVFIINRLADFNEEIGVRATVDTMADLLLEDLSAGSSALRRDIPGLADSCPLLMKVDDVYRIQTEESTAWNDEFRKQEREIGGSIQQIDAVRNERVRRIFGELAKGKLTVNQGAPKVPRRLVPVFDEQRPKGDGADVVHVWIRDSLGITEKAMRQEAASDGNTSPTIFVFVPVGRQNALAEAIKVYKAALATIDARGAPSSPGAKEALRAMKTRMDAADKGIDEIIRDAFFKVVVFQGGGTEVPGDDLAKKLGEAAAASVKRLYPEFPAGDHAGWTKVFAKAREGATDALKFVGDTGEVPANKVCKPLLEYLALQRSGKDVRGRYEGPPFGWPQDCVNGALLVLLNAGLVKATDESGGAVGLKSLDSKGIVASNFRRENVSLTVKERVEIRGLFGKLGLSTKDHDESSFSGEFIERLVACARAAGGDPPLPAPPSIAFIEELRLKGGNEQLLAFFAAKDDIQGKIMKWEAEAEAIKRRLPAWLQLKELTVAADGLAAAADTLEQVKAIERDRRLLDNPDPVQPVLAELSKILKDELSELDRQYAAAYDDILNELKGDSGWVGLEETQREELMNGYGLGAADRPEIKTQTQQDLVETLKTYPLRHLGEKIAAVPSHMAALAGELTRRVEPETRFVKMRPGTFRSDSEIDIWVDDLRGRLKEALQQGGPVKIG
ncbi:MAG: BREX system P-loop protein BrxC [Deltaproteobacteria bacterium]|jgi:hypothetical protein|nr:BREX system P-loop protein BrxC [Deltaproteobacteria bacterium]